MHFVALIKWRQKMTREGVERTLKQLEYAAKLGVRVESIYWTLGQYNAVLLLEAPDEKAAMKLVISGGDFSTTEILVAIPVEEARKLVE